MRLTMPNLSRTTSQATRCRAVRETTRTPDDPGKGTMWRCYQKFREERTLALGKDHEDMSPNDIQKQIGKEWQAERTRLQRHPALRLQQIADSTESWALATLEGKAGAADTTKGTKAGAAAPTRKGKAGASNPKQDPQSSSDPACEVCGLTSRADDMLLCDACDKMRVATETRDGMLRRSSFGQKPQGHGTPVRERTGQSSPHSCNEESAMG